MTWMKKELNTRHRRLLAFIHEYKEVRPYSPDMREMAKAIECSSTSVMNYYLNRLEDEGLISFLYTDTPGKFHNMRAARTVHLTEQGKKYVAELLKTERKPTAESIIANWVDAQGWTTKINQ